MTPSNHGIKHPSPYHVQAWVFVGWKATVEQQAELARSLAMQYDGDMGAAHEKQLGRAPGFYNRKPQYRNDVGRFPLVQQIPHRLDKLISEPRNVPLTDAVTPPPSHARRAARGAGVQVKRRTLQSDDASEDRPYTGPLHIFDNSRFITTISALPDLGSVEDAYENAERLMAKEGYVPKPLRNGEVDRSLHDLRVAETIIYCGYGRSFAIDVIALTSPKASERDERNADAYAADRVDRACEWLFG